MNYYYAASTGGFYDGYSVNRPEDAIEITEELYISLLSGNQEKAQIIMPPDASHALPWLADRPVPPPPTLEEQQNAFTNAIQARLDVFAKTRGYDSIHTAASYAGDQDPMFALEGKYAKEIRSATWRVAYSVLNAVLAGERPMPTLEEVFAELPFLAWPDEG